MLHPGPAAPPSPAPATQALGRKSLGSRVSWAGPAGSGCQICSPSYPLACPPGQSTPLPALPIELQPDLAGRTNPTIPIFLATIPPSAHPEGLIPGGSAGCILSLAAESMAGGAGAEVGIGAKVQVRASRVGAPLSCSLRLGPTEKEEGSCPAPSGNEREVGVMGRNLRHLCLPGFSVLPLGCK